MDTIVVIVVGIVVVVFVILLLTGKLNWKTLLGLVGVGAAVGAVAVLNKRRDDALQKYEAKEKELQKKAEDLEALKEKQQITQEELDTQKEALNKERDDYARSVLKIDAEKESNIEAAKQKVDQMSRSELQDALKQLGSS